jgi:hypothetical protein
VRLRGNQINPVIMALRTSGILVTALHSHMLDSSPTVVHMHFYATGEALKLVQGLRSALKCDRGESGHVIQGASRPSSASCMMVLCNPGYATLSGFRMAG